MKVDEITTEMSAVKAELEKANRETYVARLVVANIEHRIESLSLFDEFLGEGSPLKISKSHQGKILFEELSSLAFEKRQAIERREKEIRALEAKQETLRRELDLALAEDMTARMTSFEHPIAPAQSINSDHQNPGDKP